VFQLKFNFQKEKSMKKKLLSLVVVLCMVAVALIGCNGGTTDTTTDAENDVVVDADTDADTDDDTTAGGDADVPMAPLVISGFVGEPNQYQQAWIVMFEEMYPELGPVETVITDTVNRPIILRTAISAGDPPALGFFWGTRLNTFSDAGMVLDLRDHFTEEEIALINPTLLAPCIGSNGEVFALPTTTVYFTQFYNVDMLNEFGFDVPETWEDLTAIYSALAEEGIFGFSNNTQSLQDALFGMAYAELEAEVGPGTSHALASGEVSVLPGTPAGEVLRGVIQQYIDWYEAGYMYPGEGAISTSMDEANAAFARGDAFSISTFSGAFHALNEASDFEIGHFLKPVSTPGRASFENIEPSVYFIPSNATEEQINTAVAFLRLLLTPEMQQEIVNANQPPSIPSYEFENMSPLLEDIVAYLAEDNLIAGLNPVRGNTEMFNFIKEVIFTGPMSGIMTIDEVLYEFERIRLTVYAELQNVE